MKKLTLTFDNGPDPAVTPRVLDSLRRHGIKSTFFCVGTRLAVPGALDATAMAARDGHRIGNHTFSHSPPLGLRPPSDTLVRDEIVRVQDMLGSLPGGDRLFRPSGGGGNIDKRLMTPACVDYLAAEGFTVVLWHSVPGDLQGKDWVAVAREHIAERDWTLMVLHDVAGGCVERLDEFLDWVADQGIEVTQELPAECLPMVDGRAVEDMSQFTTP